MKLFRFLFTKDEETAEWNCAAVDLSAACRGFCKEHGDVAFSVTCGEPAAVIEVYGDGSGVGIT